MKATKLLTKQHDEVNSLLETLEKGKGTSATLKKLADSLAAHMVIEQELFYPAVIAVSEDLVLEAYEEHAVARFALKRLMKAEKSDHDFKAKVTTLKELIEHHVEEEENDLFPKAEKALGESSEALCDEMKALFDKTVKSGFERVVGPGGSAVKSASAPSVDQHS